MSKLLFHPESTNETYTGKCCANNMFLNIGMSLECKTVNLNKRKIIMYHFKLMSMYGFLGSHSILAEDEPTVVLKSHNPNRKVPSISILA